MKVNVRKAEHSELDQVHTEMDRFYGYFAQGMKNTFGYVSFRRVRAYVDSI